VGEAPAPETAEAVRAEETEQGEAAPAEEAEGAEAEAAPTGPPKRRRRRRGRRGRGGQRAAAEATDATAEGEAEPAAEVTEEPAPAGAEAPVSARPKRRRPARPPAAAAEAAQPEDAGEIDVLRMPLTTLPANEGDDLSEAAAEAEKPPTAQRRRKRRPPGEGGPPGAPKGEGAAGPRGHPASDGGRAAEPAPGEQPAKPAARRARSGKGPALKLVTEEEAPPKPTVSARPLRKKRRRRYRDEAEAAESRPRTMVVTKRPDRNQIAVLEDGDLVEHYVAHAQDRSIVSSIYLGRVQNVLPGMEAAFVDIGTGRNAVLYAGEVGYDDEVEGPRPRIESMLKSGQAILVQVTKDPMRHKGARLTTEISLAGRYLVFIPERESLGVSRRLPDEESERLRQIATRIRPKGHGLIVRTAADGAGEEELQRDVENLHALWNEIHERAQTAQAPSLLYTEPELVIRVVRDLMNAEIERVVVDDTEVLARIRDYIADVTPDLADRIELHNGEGSAFEDHGINEQIRRAIERKVSLRSGGSIVIDRTEAMTVVDVNTGRFVGRSNLEETVLRTNLEAAEEVAKQLRLRDIGGIIVIDFIDMLYERNREELLRVFKAALARDKTRTQVFGVSELGLIQMTRKNVSEGLLEAFSEPCDKCEGRGIVLQDLD
jgi:ribonuclease E